MPKITNKIVEKRKGWVTFDRSLMRDTRIKSTHKVIYLLFRSFAETCPDVFLSYSYIANEVGYEYNGKHELGSEEYERAMKKFVCDNLQPLIDLKWIIKINNNGASCDWEVHNHDCEDFQDREQKSTRTVNKKVHADREQKSTPRYKDFFSSKEEHQDEEKFSQNENSGSREPCVDTKEDANTGSEESVTVEDKTNSNSGVSERVGTPPADHPNATLLQQEGDKTYSPHTYALFDEFWKVYPKGNNGKKGGSKAKAFLKFAKLVENNPQIGLDIIENVKQMVDMFAICEKENQDNINDQYYASIKYPSPRWAEYYLGKDNEGFIAYKNNWLEYVKEKNKHKKSLNNFWKRLEGDNTSSGVDKNQNFSVDTTTSYNPDDFKIDY